MIRSITRQKPFDEIKSMVENISNVFIMGCGTCTTMARTGGIPEIEEMKKLNTTINTALAYR